MGRQTLLTDFRVSGCSELGEVKSEIVTPLTPMPCKLLFRLSEFSSYLFMKREREEKIYIKVSTEKSETRKKVKERPSYNQFPTWSENPGGKPEISQINNQNKQHN